jgi:hypothetical protein
MCVESAEYPKPNIISKEQHCDRRRFLALVLGSVKLEKKGFTFL